MATSDRVNWDDEVMKERAKLHAQRHPNRPLSGGATITVVVLGAAATVLACLAWGLILAL